MATPDAVEQAEFNPNEDDSASETNDLLSSSSSSDNEEESESDSDDDSDSDSPVGDDLSQPDYQSVSSVRPDGTPNPYDSDDNTEEANLRDLNKAFNSRRRRLKELELEQEEEEAPRLDELYDFPPDPENWQEEDLKELWADAPLAMTKPGWDPSNVDEEEVDIISDEIRAGRDPPIAPFYVPYRKPYPVIPDDHYDISNPKAVIEELDRIEEFLTWVSYIFPDGSMYEGTVWDDQAHGRGVFVAEEGLVRYEGDWLQNNMEGHGVVEVDVPQMQPIPGSKLEAKMRAEGQIITRDFMSPEDREWLEKDIEDSLLLADGEFEVPWYENEEWVRQFGEKPEKGRYRYAGQWKHGRMHGCGVYEVNERLTYGRFYFGELLEDSTGCDEDVSGLHAGLAEVAAAKARMFVNKPDGMVREYFGPYSDPQHPYFYEEDDMWMAPGFINQFYDVPDYWKLYVSEVDQERQMWLNSFYKAPLRLPMPSELEYWWSQDQNPEFVLINKEPEPDPNNPDKLIHTEDPLILHTPTGRLIDYMEDEEHGIRLFWLPSLGDGEEVDPEKVEFLPLGFDEFYGLEEVEQEDNFGTRLVKSVEKKTRPILNWLKNWIDEKKQAREEEVELLKAELKMVEAEVALKEAIEDLDEELKLLQKAEENRKEDPRVEADISITDSTRELEQAPPERELEAGAEEEEEEEEEEEDDVIPSSFGLVEDKKSNYNDQNGGKSGKSTLASVSLSFASSNLVSLVPTKLHDSFSRWKGENFPNQTSPTIPRGQFHQPTPNSQSFCMVSFPRTANKNLKLRCVRQTRPAGHIPKLGLRNHSNRKASPELGRVLGHFNILSLHTPPPVSR